MGHGAPHPPVLLFTAVISRYDEALAWTAERSSHAWGPIAERSEAFDFTETDYYASTMGNSLKKQFLAFQRPIDPASLPHIKLQSGTWEEEYARLGRHPEPRPVNLDPGYLTPAKIVLASTKDHAHRLYLGEGIYGEVTLYFRQGRWQHREWTYPDYRRPDFQDFFLRLRDDWQRRIREARPT
ncbi:MAG TPA: DUF4416 family protein [Pirellulales bacterium]|jgi:hypothetical protein|nr:DUF4416 family protein [Pirellulales bacterium]